MFRRMTRERYLSDAELEALMSVARGRRHVHQPRDHALLALLANTGIRPAEARALTRGDVHPNAKTPWIRLRRVKKGHAASPVNELPIHPAVAKVLARYVATLESRRSAKLFPFTPRQSARLFHYYAKKAGLPGHHRIYALRHTVGMRLWRHTGDVRMIQGIMGHVRLKASSAYVHIGPERMRDAQSKLGTIQ